MILRIFLCVCVCVCVQRLLQLIPFVCNRVISYANLRDIQKGRRESPTAPFVVIVVMFEFVVGAQKKKNIREDVTDGHEEIAGGEDTTVGI